VSKLDKWGLLLSLLIAALGGLPGRMPGSPITALFGRCAESSKKRP